MIFLPGCAVADCEGGEVGGDHDDGDDHVGGDHEDGDDHDHGGFFTGLCSCGL